jgi:16S rRNA (uracil1498-N3)-methyltransferase
MRVYRLFCERLSVGEVLLSPEESHHALASLRAKPGAEVTLFDGAGAEGAGQISRVHRRQVCVNVTRLSTRPFELAHRITLAVAMAKAHRQGYLVEKCTELGVAAIWPIIALHSASKPRKAETTVQKWSRRAIEAAKQSGRAWVPKVAAVQTLADSVKRVSDFSASALTVVDSSQTPLGGFIASQAEGSSVLVWVGPEGGWSDDERDLALGAGATPTTLGPTTLRTETAAVAVCAAASMCSVQRNRVSQSR